MRFFFILNILFYKIQVATLHWNINHVTNINKYTNKNKYNYKYKTEQAFKYILNIHLEGLIVPKKKMFRKNYDQ